MFSEHRLKNKNLFFKKMGEVFHYYKPKASWTWHPRHSTLESQGNISRYDEMGQGTWFKCGRPGFKSCHKAQSCFLLINDHAQI